MNLGIKLMFCTHLGIHQYTYMIQPIQMSGEVYLAMPKVIPYILQCVKTELSYNTDFLHTGRHSQKQKIAAISCSLTVWFLSWEAQKFLCKSDCLILFYKISPEGLELLTSFLTRQFNIMSENNWTNFGYKWVMGIFAGVP